MQFVLALFKQGIAIKDKRKDMTVWIIQKPRPNKRDWTPDFSSAEKFGRIEFVFDEHEKVFAMPNPAKEKARRVFREKFNYETDYILWPNLGDPQAMIAAMIGLFQEHLGHIEFINALQWDRKRDEYGQRGRDGFYVPIKYNLK